VAVRRQSGAVGRGVRRASIVAFSRASYPIGDFNAIDPLLKTWKNRKMKEKSG
jgi:hypothetical protein